MANAKKIVTKTSDEQVLPYDPLQVRRGAVFYAPTKRYKGNKLNVQNYVKIITINEKHDNF